VPRSVFLTRDVKADFRCRHPFTGTAASIAMVFCDHSQLPYAFGVGAMSQAT